MESEQSLKLYSLIFPYGRGQTEAARMAEQHVAADARAAAAGEDLVKSQVAAEGELDGARAEAAAARADARAAQDALAAAAAGFEASKAGFEKRSSRLAAEAAARAGRSGGGCRARRAGMASAAT